MIILAYITDLFLQADVGKCVVEAGGKLKAVTSLYKFLPELEKKTDLVFLDLSAEGINAGSLIAQLVSREKRPPVVLAAGPNQIEEARRTGADYVIDRAETAAELPPVLQKIADAK